MPRDGSFSQALSHILTGKENRAILSLQHVTPCVPLKTAGNDTTQYAA